MLSSYLNQTCTLRHKTGTNARGQPVMGEPAEVPCRLEKKFQLIKKANGETVPVKHICYLTAAVMIGDSINGLKVEAVDEWTDYGGEIVGYKAVM